MNERGIPSNPRGQELSLSIRRVLRALHTHFLKLISLMVTYGILFLMQLSCHTKEVMDNDIIREADLGFSMYADCSATTPEYL